MKKTLLPLLLCTFCVESKAQLSTSSLPLPLNRGGKPIERDSVRKAHTKKNFVLFSVCAGAGDYPSAGFGLTFNRQLGESGKTFLGFGVHYIGNTINTENGLLRDEFVQIIPFMLDLRREFSRSSSGLFSTSFFLDAGYIVSITGNEFDENGEYEHQNGWAINPGVSFKLDFSPHVGLILDLGWMRHTSRLKWLPPSEMVGRKEWNVGLARATVFF